MAPRSLVGLLFLVAALAACVDTAVALPGTSALRRMWGARGACRNTLERVQVHTVKISVDRRTVPAWTMIGPIFQRWNFNPPQRFSGAFNCRAITCKPGVACAKRYSLHA
jgi:hypothetical protein